MWFLDLETFNAIICSILFAINLDSSDYDHLQVFFLLMVDFLKRKILVDKTTLYIMEIRITKYEKGAI